MLIGPIDDVEQAPIRLCPLVSTFIQLCQFFVNFKIISPLLSACVHLCSEVFILSICSLGTIGGIVGVGWKRRNSSFHDFDFENEKDFEKDFENEKDGRRCALIMLFF